ncbi:MAG: hypothetical protein AAB916_00680 [Patescibacteria group bacterium]
MLTLSGVSIEAAGFEVGQTRMGRTWGWQEFHARNSRPTMLDLHVSVDVQGEDVIPFMVFGGEVEPLRGYTTLSVPVRWEKGIPITRRTGIDNTDVHFLGYDGRDLDIQVGVITRRGLFFVTAQQVAKGRIVRGRQGYEYIPTDPIHAYPGFRYDQIWPKMGEAVEQVARQFGTSRQCWSVLRLAEVRRAVWQPTYLPEREGWLRGAPFFYNMISGTGHIGELRTMTVDATRQQVESVDIGRKCFVHFSKVPDRLVPVLEPMKTVYFQLGPQKDGDRLPQVAAVEVSAAS